MGQGGAAEVSYGGHLAEGLQYSMLYGSSNKNSHNSLKTWRIYKGIALLQTLSTWLRFWTRICLMSFFIWTSYKYADGSDVYNKPIRLKIG